MTWKDGLVAAMALAVAGIVWAAVAGNEAAKLGDFRLAILAVGLLGIAMCIAGATVNPAEGSLYTIIMGALAGIVSIAVIVGMAFGGRLALFTAAIAIGVMWLATTVRHIFV